MSVDTKHDGASAGIDSHGGDENMIGTGRCFPRDLSGDLAVVERDLVPAVDESLYAEIARLRARRVPRYDLLPPGLYERLGYETVGVIEGYPAGSVAAGTARTCEASAL